MEPEASLLHSQVPATCPYPEPDRSNLFTLPCRLFINFQLEQFNVKNFCIVPTEFIYVYRTK
jgi:hypothetical protein